MKPSDHIAAVLLEDATFPEPGDGTKGLILSVDAESPAILKSNVTTGEKDLVWDAASACPDLVGTAFLHQCAAEFLVGVGVTLAAGRALDPTAYFDDNEPEIVYELQNFSARDVRDIRAYLDNNGQLL